MYGITQQGFALKRFEDIKQETENSLRSKLGNAINLLPDELLGQIVGIFSERKALIWELAQAVYNSQYPDTANGINLDHVVAITGIRRLPGNPSTLVGVAFGAQGTMIPQGSLVSVEGNPQAVFATDAEVTIGAGTDAIQQITFSAVPSIGSFTLIFEEEESVPINFNATAVDVQNALNGLNGLSTVIVSGSFASGFVVTFTNNDGEQAQELLSVGQNDLQLGMVNVGINVTSITEGVLPNIPVTLTATENGPLAAPTGTLTVIETVVAGWDAFTNTQDAELGRNVETDAELRLRRLRTLANPGTTTVEAIRSRLLQLTDVKDVEVYENRTFVTDSFGRPPKSVHAVVLGGTDQEIAEELWQITPVGIERFGSVAVPVLDSQGFTQTMHFDRPVPVPIWLEVDVATDATFPIDGDLLIRDKILEFAEKNFQIGDDVITVSLICPIIDIDGVTDVELRIGIISNPTLDDNIPINPIQIAEFDSARIAVNIS